MARKKKWGKIGAPKSARRKAHLASIRKKRGKSAKKGNPKVENPIKLRDVKNAIAAGELTPPRCPECGSRNVWAHRKARVDFYGIPVVWRCHDCYRRPWEKEILSLTD